MKYLVVALLIFCNSTICHSQTTNKEAINIVRNMAKELMEIANLPGMSIAISKKGEIVFAEGFGYADIKNKIPVTTKTQFRTASVAKVITATAISKLVQDGILDLTKPISEYVSYFPKEKYSLTSMQLAGHISGLTPDDEKSDNRFYSSVRDALGVFSYRPLVTEPGTAYNYSTPGYTLLSAVIEEATGMHYLDYLKKEILQPLNMMSTEPDLRLHHPNPKVAKLYEFKDGISIEILNPEDVSYKWAGGGLLSTPTDLINLAKGYSNGFLKPEMVMKMLTSQELKSGEKTQVGIGWRISQDIDGRRVFEHAGGMEGTRTIVCLFPAEELVISIMVNARWTSSIEETAHMLVRPFMVNKTQTTLPQGEFKILTAKKSKGNDLVSKGKLIFKGSIGKMILDDGQKFSIIHLDNNVYGLISSQGIYYLSVNIKGESIAGEAIMYGTRLLESPIKDAPFFKFTSES